MDSKATSIHDGADETVDTMMIEDAGKARVLNTRRIVIILGIVLGLTAAAAVTGWFVSEEMLFKRAVNKMEMNDSYDVSINETCKALEPSWQDEEEDDDDEVDILSGQTNSSHREMKKKCPYLAASSWGGSTSLENIAKCLQYNANRGCSACCSVSSNGVYYNFNKARWESTCYCGTAGLYDVIKTCS
jgi:hypothetical protein